MPTRSRLAKLHQFFFVLLICLLPTQLGRHFWPTWAYVLGLRVDYLAPTVYLTDLLVGVILILWLIEKRPRLELKKHFFLLATLAFLLVNSWLAQNQGAAFYKLIKVAELTALGFYVAKNRPLSRVVYRWLPLGIIYSSLIALAQFFKQASLGGWLWWLGERAFTGLTPGIAKTIAEGRLLLRPYATFPHPNVLAGFVLVALILVGLSRPRVKANSIWWWPTLILGIVTLVIAFSRTVWLTAAIVAVGLAAKRLKKVWLLLSGGGLFLAVLYFAGRFSTPEAISYRIQLTQVASGMLQTAPLVGVGLNNFVVRLPEFWPQQRIYWLQPVHNLFLLLAAETGLVGLVIFFWFLILTYRRLLRKNWLSPPNTPQPLLIALGAILLLGLMDHYWLTLQQAQLLGVIVLGLSWQ